jgi:very-short-patch-repair endonuclease
MTKLYIILGIVIALVILAEILFGKEKRGYQYIRKQFFMTKAEHEFFDALMTAVGDRFYIFAQVHLPTLLDHKVKGQSWVGAFSHINRKSVDFVLCDKEYISPKLAIELDDKSHERPDRIDRDREVERMLKEAGFPLLRIENQHSYNPTELVEKINEILR